MSATPVMTTPEWVRTVDARRRDDDLLARGEWHGYLNDGSMVVRGRFILLRWARPSIVVAHDNVEALFELARTIERAVSK